LLRACQPIGATRKIAAPTFEIEWAVAIEQRKPRRQGCYLFIRRKLFA
jgi:hypothetical protein